MMKKKNGNGQPEMDENNAYPKWVKEDIKEQKKDEERRANGKNGKPTMLSIPSSWLASLSLLFFYTGLLTVTTTCLLSKVLYLV